MCDDDFIPTVRESIPISDVMFPPPLGPDAASEEPADGLTLLSHIFSHIHTINCATLSIAKVSIAKEEEEHSNDHKERCREMSAVTPNRRLRNVFL